MRREPAKPLILCTAWTPETPMDGIPTNYEPEGRMFESCRAHHPRNHLDTAPLLSRLPSRKPGETVTKSMLPHPGTISTPHLNAPRVRC